MKKLQLQNVKYQQYEEGFKQWLYRMGVCPGVHRDMPMHVREMLHFMEDRGIDEIEKIGVKDIRDYFAHLGTRPNERRKGVISTSYYNRQLNGIKKFSKYLWHQHHIWLTVRIKSKVNQYRYPTVLTIKEIKSLYATTQTDRLLCLRDQTLLDVYYSCGLRRNEGAQLKVEQVNIARRILHVTHGKNYTQRYVPFTKLVAKRFEIYIRYSRPYLLGSCNHQQLLVSTRGNAMSGMGIYGRLLKLQQKCDNTELRRKHIGLHTLRHSIATHLMRGGMSIDQIAHFLGHKTIRSTQIYTHLISEKDNLP